jgi:hypothetical protein
MISDSYDVCCFFGVPRSSGCEGRKFLGDGDKRQKLSGRITVKIADILYRSSSTGWAVVEQIFRPDVCQGGKNIGFDFGINGA